MSGIPAGRPRATAPRLVPAKAEDAEYARVLLEALEERSFEPDAFAHFFAANLRKEEIAYFLIAEGEGRRGFASLHFQPLLHHLGTVAEIQELVVEAGARGRGLGGAALRLLGAEAERRGAVLLEVATNLRRLGARAFYAANGFSESHAKLTLSLPRP